MDNPFNNLKNVMKKTVFKDLTFSNERKDAVKKVIQGKQSQLNLHSWKESIIIEILEILQLEQKHGYDISTLLFQKHEFCFQKNEGLLYTLLHLLENKEFLSSKWINEKKYYTLTTKGKKYAAAYKQESTKQLTSLKHLIEEASL
ncbi:PadR family transcriptional regulator [Cytobacillus praedii]|uniref:PadR family transcriptional regulator n=1 Tax=Cytobacillus praedii TaxID=1742358 RepID=UPI002E20F2F6|nr:PadR family transcriptional regulator [Cytobacillus praedii]